MWIKKLKIKYPVISAIGTLIIIAVTWILTREFNLWFLASLFIAILASIDVCYLLNNHWAFISSIPSKTINAIRYFFKYYKELIKFAVVGGIGTLFNFTLLYIITDKGGINYLLSATFAALCTTIVNYSLNHFWTFRKAKIKDNWFTGWLRYKLIDDLTIFIYLGQLALFVQVFHMWYMFGAVLATVINYPIRYFILKRLIWDIKKHSQEEADYEWNSYYTGGIMQMWWKRKIANTVWEWIPNGGKLLDVGCGSSPIIGKYDNAVALDKNMSKLDFMKRQFKNIQFLDNDITYYADNSFDNVLFIEVIEHLDNPALMVKEISRVLKVGGKAIIATPDYSKPLWRMAEMFTPYKEEHHNNFTMDKLDRLCEKYNLMPTIYRYVAGCDLIEMFVKGDKVNG